MIGRPNLRQDRPNPRLDGPAEPEPSNKKQDNSTSDDNRRSISNPPYHISNEIKIREVKGS